MGEVPNEVQWGGAWHGIVQYQKLNVLHEFEWTPIILLTAEYKNKIMMIIIIMQLK